MAVEAPFSPVGEEAHAENLQLMRAADLVVVTAVPVSHGNARNLEAARDALAAGIPVWADEGLRANDFVGAVEGLAEGGAQFFAGEEALLAAVRGRSLPGGRAPAVSAAAARVAAPASADDPTPTAATTRRPGRRPRRGDGTGGHARCAARPASPHHPGRPPVRAPAAGRRPPRPRRPAQASVTASALADSSARATASALASRPGRVSPPGARPGPPSSRAIAPPNSIPWMRLPCAGDPARRCLLDILEEIKGQSPEGQTTPCRGNSSAPRTTPSSTRRSRMLAEQLPELGGVRPVLLRATCRTGAPAAPACRRTASRTPRGSARRPPRPGRAARRRPAS